MSTILQCDAPVRGDKLKNRESRNQSQLQFYGGGGGLVFSVPLQEQFTENAKTSYHVCKVIDGLHIYQKPFWYQISRISCKQN